MFSIIEWEGVEAGRATEYLLYQKRYKLGREIVSGWAMIVRKYEETPLVIFNVGGSVMWVNPGLAKWSGLSKLIEEANSRLEW